MKAILTLLLFLFSIVIFGQDSIDLESKISIKTSPLNLLDPWNGTSINLGIEFKIHKNIASYTEFGLYNKQFDVWTDMEKNQGFILKEEFKYYLNTKKLTKGEYISIELCYSEQSYYRTDTINFAITGSSKLKYGKRYSVSRSFFGIAFQAGAQLVKKKRLTIDIYGGVGLRLNNVNCDLTDDEAKNRELGDWNNPKNWIQKSGQNIIPKANLGIKIGFRIK